MSSSAAPSSGLPLPYVISTVASEPFLFEQLTGTENISQPFEYQVQLLSPAQQLPLHDALGQRLTVCVPLADAGERYFNGIISNFAYVGAQGAYARYTATLTPWLGLLRLTRNSRIWQHQSVPDIVKQIFREHGFSDFTERLSNSYEKHEYRVQYHESDFDFAMRLLQQEGIYYFFVHERNKHTLVLADSPAAHLPVSGYEEVPYMRPVTDQNAPPNRLSWRGRGSITHWSSTQKLIPAGYLLEEYSFESPHKNTAHQAQCTLPTTPASLLKYLFCATRQHAQQQKNAIKVRQQATAAAQEIYTAGTDCAALVTGHTFTFTCFPRADQNKQYLILGTMVLLRAPQNPTSQPAAIIDGFTTYESTLRLVDATVQYRAHEHICPRPVAHGTESAVVVGKEGEDIFTDAYGRIKIKFHWDRHNQADETASCWVRVAQMWAGSQWGSQFIPRVGQEVLVQFVGADPDHPVVVGSLYNANHKPPYALPQHKTMSGIKTRSTGRSGVNDANEIRFEDQRGEEEVYLQAQRNLSTLVKHQEKRVVKDRRVTLVNANEILVVGVSRRSVITGEERLWVGADRNTTVKHDDDLRVKGDRHVDIKGDAKVCVAKTRKVEVKGEERLEAGADMVTLVKGNRSSVVDGNASSLVHGNSTVTIKGERSEQVKKDVALEVKGSRTQVIKIDDTLRVRQYLGIEGGEQIALVAGKASIVLKKDGTIQIIGTSVQIEGSKDLKIKFDGNMTAKAAKINLN